MRLTGNCDRRSALRSEVRDVEPAIAPVATGRALDEPDADVADVGVKDVDAVTLAVHPAGGHRGRRGEHAAGPTDVLEKQPVVAAAGVAGGDHAVGDGATVWHLVAHVMLGRH